MLDFKKFNPVPHFETLEEFKNWAVAKVSHISAETFGWLAVIVLHAATIPSLFAVMNGLTDKMPAVDLVLLCIKAAVQKDMLNVVTIGVGFIIQSAMMALIFFK